MNKYKKKLLESLKDNYDYNNIMCIPGLVKVVINMGLGSAVQNKKILEASLNELTLIAGQKAVFTYAKKSISNFKLRVGDIIGCKVTLRRQRMYQFLEKLVHIALPRVRDFRGISSRSFDGHGNYSLGIKEQIIFPEINYDKMERISGMDITVVTTAKDDNEGKILLRNMGFPFKD